MNSIFEGMTGLDKMSDQIIAADLLLASKTAVKSYAIAIAEAASPEVRNALKRQFDDAVNMQEKISNYMIENGYYEPYNVQEQLRMDIQAADLALSLQK